MGRNASEAFQPKRAGATAVALDYLADHDIDPAIVNYTLREGTGEPLIHYLHDHAIPFIVVSGFNVKMHDWVLTPQILEKPIAGTDLLRALSEAINDQPAAPLPVCRRG